MNGRMGSLPRALMPELHEASCVPNTVFSGISEVDDDNSCDLVQIDQSGPYSPSRS